MAKLKNTPIVLSVINVVSILMGLLACGGLFFLFLNILEGGKDIEKAICLVVAGILSYSLLGGLYHIVKAACLFIEKEEETKKEAE